MLLSVEPFNPERHHRDAFSSGAASVDNFLKLTARKYIDAHIATVFVICDEYDAIVGYYALTAISIDASELGASKSAKLFKKFSTVPASLLTMLGVDKNWQGQGIGKLLLADALRRCLAASKQVASHCVVLDVLDDEDTENIARRRSMYERLGFRRCDTENSMRMFLTMSELELNLVEWPD